MIKLATISNKYQIERRYIKTGNARSGQSINRVRFIVSHETSNNTATADNHFTHLNNNQPSGSAHTFIDHLKVLEVIPLTEKAWHVQYDKPLDNQLFGDDANDAAIGVELCRTGDFAKAYDRYVWYHAYLCKKFDLDPRKHIVSHRKLDPQRRSDPESWLNPNGVTWDNFINHVADYYNRWDINQTVTTTSTTSADSADGKLVRGERGPNVQLLNQMLKTLEYTTKSDDFFDQYTEAALKVFQKVHGLPQDGVYTSAVGEVMLKAIANKQIKSNTIKVDPLPAKAPEMIRLAKLIDTTNPELMEKLKAEGYIVVDIPE
jgi:N-acetylmuramoyl-L-alanine amidase